MEWPDGVDYPGSPADGNIGEGFQGDGYLHPLLNLALAYQVLVTTEPSAASRYAQKGIEVLLKMSEPFGSPHWQDPLRDSGFGLRFYGVGMALGFDWLHEELGDGERSRVVNALNDWISRFELGDGGNHSAGGFGKGHPQGNYFAGYYAAKALTALATEGENPISPIAWQDWLERLHRTLVQPYYSTWLAGGGWPEGWGYGALGTLNMTWPVLAALTAKGVDLVRSTAPFAFPLDQGRHLIYSAWPSLQTLDDRGTVQSGDNPSSAEPALFTSVAGILSLLADPLAPTFHRFAREIRGVQETRSELWQDFLFWDEDAPEEDYAQLPLSFLAEGMGLALVRSSWTGDASWASFIAGPYISFPDSGEESFDKGSLAIRRGSTPFLVNAIGWLLRNTVPGQDDSNGYWDPSYTDNWGEPGNRTLYNIFYVRTPRRFGQGAFGPDQVRTRMDRFEDGGAYVLLRGVHLEDMYRLDAEARPVVSWTRTVIYVRPQIFIVYDRTCAFSSSADQWMAFHLARMPLEVEAPEMGTHRFDVASGNSYSGSVTTLLPANSAVQLVNVFDSGKVFRLEVRPSAPGASQRWLTVFDAAPSAAGVARAKAMTLETDTIQGGEVLGVLLKTGEGDLVVLAGAGEAGDAVTEEVRYRVPAEETGHLLTDLPPSSKYAVSITVLGMEHSVHVTPDPAGSLMSIATRLIQKLRGAGDLAKTGPLCA